MKPGDVWLPKALPWDAPDWNEDVAFAVRALATGTANDAQQRTVWAWMKYVTRTGDYADLSFRPGADGERATNFAEGMRFVGLQLNKMATSPLVTEAINAAMRKRPAPPAQTPKPTMTVTKRKRRKKR